MFDLSFIKSLLITGANGFVGRSIIDELATLDEKQLPMKLLLCTREGLTYNLPAKLKNISFVEVRDLTQEWFFNYPVSHVIHLAADGSKFPYSIEANQTFSRIIDNLITWSSTLEVSPRLFHASSGACAGYKPNGEQGKIDNRKAGFAENRLRAENTLIEASERFGFELSIGRLYTFSGTHLLPKKQYAISEFVSSASTSKIIDVKGHPGTVRSYLHQEHLAKWIIKALICESTYTDLQIGSNNPVTVGELAEYIAEKTSSDIIYSVNPTPRDIYLPANEETRCRLDVEEGKNWKIAVNEMLNEIRRTHCGNF